MLVLARILCLALTTAFVSVPVSAQLVRQFPDTHARIAVFSEQLPSSLSSGQLSFVASHYVGTQKIPRTQIDAIRANNPAFILLHYRLGCEDGPAPILIGETWTNAKWTTYVNPQNSWFWLNSSARIHNTDWDWYMMDIQQLGAGTWSEYWRTQVVSEMRTNAADGVFADSFDPLIGGFGAPLPSEMDYPGALTGLYPPLNAWAQAVLDSFATTPEHFMFVPNYGALVTGWNTVLDLTRCDGCMVEGFGDWGTSPLYGEFGDWQLQMNRCLQISRAGKGIIAQHYLSSAAAVDERMFVLGMYLLIKGDHTMVNMMAADSLEWYPEYGINLGTDATALPANVDGYISAGWGGLYRRDFQRGVVVVNPTDSTISVPALGRTYWRATPSGGGGVPVSGVAPGSVGYTPVTSLSLASNRAAVLMLQDPVTGVGDWQVYD